MPRIKPYKSDRNVKERTLDQNTLRIVGLYSMRTPMILILNHMKDYFVRKMGHLENLNALRCQSKKHNEKRRSNKQVYDLQP